MTERFMPYDLRGVVVPNAYVDTEAGNRVVYCRAGTTPVEIDEDAAYQDTLTSEADYSTAIQAHIDRTAQSRQYADGVSLASYTTSTLPQWAAEAFAFVSWRDAVWIYAYEQLARVKAGQRTQPTISELVDDLPVIQWPSA